MTKTEALNSLQKKAMEQEEKIRKLEDMAEKMGNVEAMAIARMFRELHNKISQTVTEPESTTIH